MGKVCVNVELVYNNTTGGVAPRVTIRGLVSTGSSRRAIPAQTVSELGLRVTGQIWVRYGEGHEEIRDLVGGVRLGYLGRSAVLSAVVEPGRTDVLIRAIVLDELNLLADCGRGKLVPRDSVALPDPGR